MLAAVCQSNSEFAMCTDTNYALQSGSYMAASLACSVASTDNEHTARLSVMCVLFHYF